MDSLHPVSMAIHRIHQIHAWLASIHVPDAISQSKTTFNTILTETVVLQLQIGLPEQMSSSPASEVRLKLLHLLGDNPMRSGRKLGTIGPAATSKHNRETQHRQ